MIHPYIEACFQKSRVRTSAQEGTSPQWNETLSIEVQPPNGSLSSNSLLESEIGMENLFLNLFDEVTINMKDKADADNDKIIHQRKERNWLGSMNMPFSTIWERVRIDGIFHMKIPMITLGYERANSVVATETPLLAGLISSGETLLHLFITLDPPLVQPQKLKLKFQSEEPEKFLSYCKNWLIPLEKHKRVIFNTTVSIEGKTTFICRYIQKQKPPSGLESVANMTRYVATIPFIPNRTAFAAECMIWCTSDQMLKIGAGDFAEHAILLCNFFLHTGLDAFVLLGRGLPEGIVSYVLVRDQVNLSNDNLATIENTQDPPLKNDKLAPQKYVLYNPVTGDSYRLFDTHIPLKEIGCLFNSDNVI